MILKQNKHLNVFLIKYQVMRVFIECDQEIKVNFRQSKILILVVND